MTGETDREISLQEERRLVERLKEGDSSALDGLWRAHASVIYSAVIFPKLPIRDLAEEALQNTFIKAHDRIDSFTWQERGILPWLKTIARNLVIDVHRKNQRLKKFTEGYTSHVEVVESGETSKALRRPDKKLLKQEQKAKREEKVHAVLNGDKLNDRYRRAIELRLFEELGREECAERMEIKVGTFDVLFHRAVKRFETLYREAYGSPGE